MAGALKSTLAGTVSGVLTGNLAVPAMAATAAIAIPVGWPNALWTAVVVFGLGAFLPALVIHLAALRLTRANALVSLASFCIAVIATIYVATGLTYAGSALAAFVVGAIAATVASISLWSNNSFKPTPLRGAA